MKKSITWEVAGKLNKFSVDNLINLLLKNRLIIGKEKEGFLNSDLKKVTLDYVEIDKKQVRKAFERIKKAKEKNEQIIVYGDYDVDGITGTAILWETLNSFGTKVSPFIPSRADEGYGLSIKGIEHVLSEFPQTKIIITVDNGIVANEAVEFANKNGIDVIITDHHTVGKKLPNAFAIVHTTKLCGAGVGWMLSREISNVILNISEGSHSKNKKEMLKPLQGKQVQHDKVERDSSAMSQNDMIPSDHLALVALATVADLVPLINANRIVLKKGLEVLHKTKRSGIVELCQDAQIEQEKIGVYEIGHILAPRLNAMGRISSAMDSLRLLCTKDRMRAKALAEKHGLTNRERQLLTKSLSEHAIQSVLGKQSNLLFIAEESYDEGVIGLVAGKLVEEYYRPSIVIAKKEKISKASARSISGFNIIEFIRSGSHLLINAGGHPMAAGFTIATDKIGEFEKFVTQNAKKFDTSLLSKKLKIDCELDLSNVSQKLYDELQILQPFGMNNPEPVFVSRVKIISLRQIGKDRNHLSMQVTPVILSKAKDLNSKIRDSSPSVQNDNAVFSAIAFSMGDRFSELKINHSIDIVYTISENEWQNKKSLQLKIRDIHQKSGK